MISLVAASALPAPPPTHDPFMIFFARGTASIDAASQGILANFATAARSAGQRCVQITGHADVGEGSTARKMQLSTDRAAAAQRSLEANGLPSDTLKAEGVGDRHPLAPRSDPHNQFVAVDFCR